MSVSITYNIYKYMELLKRGSRGELVKQVQRALGLLADGIYGRLTEEAVRDYQGENGLTQDGIVGPRTMASLMAVRAGQLTGMKKSSRRIDEIIVHCTATPAGRDYTVADIRKWHKEKGWSDIGYHYVIYRNGECHDGRDVNVIGAHCQGHNSHSIGLVYVGGMTADGKKAADSRTVAQADALLKLLIELHRLYPSAEIKGHRDCSKDQNGNGIIEEWEWMKECPSFDVRKCYQKVLL